MRREHERATNRKRKRGRKRTEEVGSRSAEHDVLHGGDGARSSAILSQRVLRGAERVAPSRAHFKLPRLNDAGRAAPRDLGVRTAPRRSRSEGLRVSCARRAQRGGEERGDGARLGDALCGDEVDRRR